jgi:hypothetical protein
MMNEEGENIRAKRPHFDSLGELMRAHEKLFDSEPACSYLGKKLLLEERQRGQWQFLITERPFANRNIGLAECTLRVRENDGRVRQHLMSTFSKLYGIYGPLSRFEVSYTANACLKGNLDDKWSIWYGLDYSNPLDRGSASINLLHAAEDREAEGFVGYDVVRDLGDVENLRVDFDADQFARLFYENHENSDVTVHSLVSIVFISINSQSDL